LTLAVGGLITWGADAGIQATKRGINNIDKKIDEMKEEHNNSSKANSIGTEKIGTEAKAPEAEKAEPTRVFTETETRNENKTTPENNENIYPNLANSNNNNNREGPFSEAKGLRQEQADAAYARKLQEAEFHQ